MGGSNVNAGEHVLRRFFFLFDISSLSFLLFFFLMCRATLNCLEV